MANRVFVNCVVQFDMCIRHKKMTKNIYHLLYGISKIFLQGQAKFKINHRMLFKIVKYIIALM